MARTLKILFLRQKGLGYVGAPGKYHAFEQAVGKIADCRWAGRGWPLYQPNENMNNTVGRIYDKTPPDWVLDEDDGFRVPRERNYKVGYFASDLHGKNSFNVTSPRGFVRLINNSHYDAVFLKYKYIYGTSSTPDIFLRSLNTKPFFLPWSIDTKRYYPREKDFDVVFLGAASRRRYPIRNSLWKNLPSFCEEHNLRLLMKGAPPGGTFQRDIQRLMREGLIVGERYCEVLGETKILIFGCSRHRYPLQKFFEGMSSGCLVMSNEPGGAKELNFRDGYNFVSIDTRNWKEKLQYYSENESEAKRIAEQGRETILKYHTHDIRVRQFIQMLTEV